MPLGHLNALFVKDANALNQKDVMEVFREAKSQGALVFWNHPHWTPQNNGWQLTDMHKNFCRRIVSGIEIYNETSYSDEALDIAHEHQLTLMGNSDVHGLIDWQFDPSRGNTGR